MVTSVLESRFRSWLAREGALVPPNIEEEFLAGKIKVCRSALFSRKAAPRRRRRKKAAVCQNSSDLVSPNEDGPRTVHQEEEDQNIIPRPLFATEESTSSINATPIVAPTRISTTITTTTSSPASPGSSYGHEPVFGRPYPVGKGPDESSLPASLREEQVLRYDFSKYDFCSPVAEEFLGLPLSCDGNPRARACHAAQRLLEYRAGSEVSTWRPCMNRNNWSSSAGANHQLVRGCEKLCAVYETFLRQVVGPHMVRLYYRVVPEKGRRVKVLYQFPPTIRVFCPEEVFKQEDSAPEERRFKSLGRLHNDAEYGHQAAEVNFWLPLTDMHPSNTMWVESQPGRRDWRPILLRAPGGGGVDGGPLSREDGGDGPSGSDEQEDLRSPHPYGEQLSAGRTTAASAWEGETSHVAVGGRSSTDDHENVSLPSNRIAEMLRFDGTFCRHFARENSSGRTRVSLDFRCTVEEFFDATWKLPGSLHAHERRAVEFEVRGDGHVQEVVSGPVEGGKNEEGSSSCGTGCCPEQDLVEKMTPVVC